MNAIEEELRRGRAVFEEHQIRQTLALEKMTRRLEDISRRFGTNPSATNYLPFSLKDIDPWLVTVEKQFSLAGNSDEITPRIIRALPRKAISGMWYRIRSGIPVNDIYVPRHWRTRFNAATSDLEAFSAAVVTDDLSAGLFELQSHIDFEFLAQVLKRTTITRIYLSLTDVVDLTSAETLNHLGIGEGLLRQYPGEGEISVTQQISSLLYNAGIQGAIFPSGISIGKSTLLIFERNVRGGIVQIQSQSPLMED